MMFKNFFILFILSLGFFSQTSFGAGANQNQQFPAWMQPAPGNNLNNNNGFGRLGPPQIRVEYWERAVAELYANPQQNEALARGVIEYCFFVLRDPQNPQAFFKVIRLPGGQEVHREAYLNPPAAAEAQTLFNIKNMVKSIFVT